MRLPHHPQCIDELRTPTSEDPWRVLISGCLFGWRVGVDGTDYGLPAARPSWLSRGEVELVPFCPEHHGLGTPRTMPDLHGGDGYAVLDGKARVLDEHGNDLTEAVIAGARAMVELARQRDVDFAVLVDRSGVCGSQVVSLGCRFEQPVRYIKGVGVAAAALLRASIPVVSQRDFLTLERLHVRLDPDHHIDPAARDHHQHPWVLQNLG